MKRAAVILIVAMAVVGYLRLLVSVPEANPLEWFHIWSNHAHIVNEVNTARHALIDFENETGTFPLELSEALDWWASKKGAPIPMVTDSNRGELYYWSNGDTFVLSWQDPRVRSSHSSITYTPDGAFTDPNSLAALVAEGLEESTEGAR